MFAAIYFAGAYFGQAYFTLTGFTSDPRVKAKVKGSSQSKVSIKQPRVR